MNKGEHEKEPILVRAALVAGLVAIAGVVLYFRSEAMKPMTAEVAEPGREAGHQAVVQAEVAQVEPPNPEPAKSEAVKQEQPAPPRPLGAKQDAMPAATEAAPRPSREEVIKAIRLAGSDDPAMAGSQRIERESRQAAIREKQQKEAERRAAIKAKKDAERQKREAEKRDKAERDQVIEEVSSEWQNSENGLSEAEFHATLARWSGVKQCLVNHTKREAASKGTLRVRFKISNSGQVEQSKVYLKSNQTAKAIAPCVEQEAMQLRFPAFTGADSITRRATFLF